MLVFSWHKVCNVLLAILGEWYAVARSQASCVLPSLRSAGYSS